MTVPPGRPASRPGPGKLLAVAVPVVLIVGAITVLASHSSPAQARPPAVHAHLQHRWYLGVREPGAPASWAPVRAFAAATGTRPRLVLSYGGWRQPFPAAQAARARRHGAVLLLQIEPWGAPLSRIARGDYDGYLRTFARQVRAFGHPVVLGFGHEMNGPWYPWGAGHATPASFVAAWRHLVTLFRSVGADNVTWLWTVHHTASTARLRAYWPGDRYVTWVGIDGYYEFPHATFGRLFGRAVRAVRRVTRRPVLLSEAAVGPGAGHVAKRIRHLFAGARRLHLIGLVWFDVDQHDPPYHQDWRIEGKTAEVRSFRASARRAAGRHPA